jgi:predicted GNAT family acetyltransferase
MSSVTPERVMNEIGNILPGNNIFTGVWKRTNKEVQLVIDDKDLPAYSNRLVGYAAAGVIGILAGAEAALANNVSETVTVVCGSSIALGVGVLWIMTVIENVKQRKQVVDDIKNSVERLSGDDKLRIADTKRQIFQHRTTRDMVAFMESGRLEPEMIKVASTVVERIQNDEGLARYLVEHGLLFKKRWGSYTFGNKLSKKDQAQDAKDLQNALDTWKFLNGDNSKTSQRR